MQLHNQRLHLLRLAQPTLTLLSLLGTSSAIVIASIALTPLYGSSLAVPEVGHALLSCPDV